MYSEEFVNQVAADLQGGSGCVYVRVLCFTCVYQCRTVPGFVNYQIYSHNLLKRLNIGLEALAELYHFSFYN